MMAQILYTCIMAQISLFTDITAPVSYYSVMGESFVLVHRVSLSVSFNCEPMSCNFCNTIFAIDLCHLIVKNG